MAQTTTMRLRRWWLSIHKWTGILLAVLIIPISLTGSALVWHDWLDETINPQRYAVKSGERALTPSAYAAAAQRALAAGEQLMSLRFPEYDDGPILAQAVQPPQPGAARPVRTNVWLDPADGRVLDKASSDAGLVRVFHAIHGSLMVPGWGRSIVGWVGVFMFFSCLTGLWLWWPVTGSVKRGFRWKRQNSANANLHHQLGFWVAIPLAMLSFTGFWISFPSVFSVFEANPPPARSATRPPPARPLAVTRLTPDSALAAASQRNREGVLVLITFPTEQVSEWKLSFTHWGLPFEIAVNDATGEVTPRRPPRPETTARLMRRLHDGTGMGLFWQIIIFIGGIIPALLAVTGLVMWWRSRGWKAMLKKKRKARAGVLQLAE